MSSALRCRLINLSRWRKSALLFLLASFLDNQALAHPHSWITLESEFTLDESARLTAIHQVWRFDAFYSMVTLADLMNEYGDLQTGLRKASAEMVSNLQAYAYFSDLQLKGSPVELPVPVKQALVTENAEEGQDLALVMSFRFPEPLDLPQGQFTWRVYDPTYYIHMGHDGKDPIRFSKPDNVDCEVTLDIPEPTDELIEYAADLDRSQKNTQGLGIHFAETARIICHP